MTLYLTEAVEILEAESFMSEMPLLLLLPPPLPSQKWSRMKWSKDLNYERLTGVARGAACLCWMNSAAFNDEDKTCCLRDLRRYSCAVQKRRSKCSPSPFHGFSASWTKELGGLSRPDAVPPPARRQQTAPLAVKAWTPASLNPKHEARGSQHRTGLFDGARGASEVGLPTRTPHGSALDVVSSSRSAEVVGPLETSKRGGGSLCAPLWLPSVWSLQAPGLYWSNGDG